MKHRKQKGKIGRQHATNLSQKRPNLFLPFQAGKSPSLLKRLPNSYPKSGKLRTCIEKMVNAILSSLRNNIYRLTHVALNSLRLNLRYSLKSLPLVRGNPFPLLSWSSCYFIASTTLNKINNNMIHQITYRT